MVSLFTFLCLGFLLLFLSMFLLYLQLTPRENENLLIISETIRKRTSNTVDLIYASNVRENWRALEELLQFAKYKKTDLVILTDFFQNPLPEAEQSAYNHALRHVQKSFEADQTFSDVYDYIQSFRNDPSQDIVTVSAKKILKQIETGTMVLAEKMARLKEIVSRHKVVLKIIPGPFENLDLIQTLDREIASYYLNLNVIEIKNLRILGIGGLVQQDEFCPLYFQNRDYYEGTKEANDELKKMLCDSIDIFVSYCPIRYFTDNIQEERNIRECICEYLPGKLILTSQSASKENLKHFITASDAALIKGGHFGSQRQFWEIEADRQGVVRKQFSFI